MRFQFQLIFQFNNGFRILLNFEAARFFIPSEMFAKENWD